MHAIVDEAVERADSHMQTRVGRGVVDEDAPVVVEFREERVRPVEGVVAVAGVRDFVERRAQSVPPEFPKTTPFACASASRARIKATRSSNSFR